jgi:hypothetical protein
MSKVRDWEVEKIDPQKWDTSSYSTDDLDYDFQSTLDSWRTYEVAENSVEQADQFLEEKYGGGVDFAAIYGSSVHGLTIFSDAILPRSHEPGDKWFDDSDIDMMVGLERPDQDIDEKEYRRDAARILYEGHDDVSEYPEVKVHPLVEFSDSFIGTLSEAREDWLESGGNPNEKITLRAQPTEDGEVYEIDRYWHNFLRCMSEGIAFSEDFYSGDFHNEFKKGRFVITEGNDFWDPAFDEDDFGENQRFDLDEFYEITMSGKVGSKQGKVFRQDLDFESSGLEHFQSEPNRPERLNRNVVYGLWERAKRNSDLEIPSNHDLAYRMAEASEESVQADPLELRRQKKRKSEGEWPGTSISKSLMEANFSDRELAELFPGNLISSKTEWVEEMKEERPEEFERRKGLIEDIFMDSIDDVERFFPQAVREDLELSSYAPEGEIEEFDDFSGAVSRQLRKDMPLEFYLIADFAIDRIKSRYRELEDDFDLEDGIHEYSLEELNQVGQTRFGEDW